jgi:uridylate kinase
MRKKVIVLSLGGSLIIPKDISVKFLREFRKVVRKNLKNYKFVIVCGGGSIARKYISALRDEKINDKMQSLSGIWTTRTNARFVSSFFNEEKEIPLKMETVKKYLKEQNIVFVGALEYKPNQTSDATSAEIAHELKTSFVNLTDIKGVFDKNPKKFKNAKFIPKIQGKDFYKMANKIKFKPGEHFVLGQTASKIIFKNKIPTYIMGNNMKNLDNFLNSKKFVGTRIEN